MKGSINVLYILQAHPACELHATISVCSRSSIEGGDIDAVPESTPNDPGAQLLLIMTWINCMAGVEDEVGS